MPFHKYSSIDLVRSGSVAALEGAVAKAGAPDASSAYVITEKVDGCNLQLTFSAEGELAIGRRNGWIKDDESFYDVRGTVHKLQPAVERLKQYAREQNTGLTVFCEYYGTAVLPRIPYSVDRALLFLDIYVGKRRLPYVDFEQLLKELDLLHMAAPVLAVVHSAAEALAFPVEGLHSALAPPGTQVEGVVVRPRDVVAYDSRHSPMLFKIKARAFLEIENCKRAKKAPSEAQLAAQQALNGYCCASRAHGIVSKEGPPKDKADIGKRLVPALIADARADMSLDMPEVDVLSVAPNKGVLFSLFLPYLP